MIEHGGSSLTIDVQFSPAVADWPLLLEATLAAEEAGASAVWVFDHLAGQSLRGHGMLECFTWLGALAAATRSIELGAMVVNVWNREPGVLAVAASSTAEIAGRQVHLGLGAGTSPTSPYAGEQHAVGAFIAPVLADRHARVLRVLELLDDMWRPDRDASFESFPRPTIRPRTIVGVNSAPLARIAGERANGINVPWTHPRRGELLATAADAAGGRPFERTTYVWWSDELFDPDHPERRAMRDAGIERLVLTQMERPDPDAIAAAFRRYRPGSLDR